MQKAELIRILRSVLTQPTAPFKEKAVASLVTSFCKAEGADVAMDPFGNLIARYRPAGRRKAGRVAFVAHMDHPGFEIVAAKGKTATAQWWGGVWKEYFEDAAVIVHEQGGVRGRVKKVTPVKGAPRRVETMELSLEKPVGVGSAGQWDLTPFEMRGDLVVTRSADDLCSVAMQLALLRELQRAQVPQEVWLIFTRAEENGFNGALAMLKEREIPDDLPLVSLETSKRLPGAEQGKGPVVRLGDRRSVFDTSLLYFMEHCAAELAKHEKRFVWQRRVMDGGVCEASAFVAYGYMAAGIAFPLGNYHNMGDEPEDVGRFVLRPETVDMRDLVNGLKLMMEMCARIGERERPLAVMKKEYETRNRPYYRRLKETPL